MLTYDESIARLQEIVQQLEDGKAVGMDKYASLAKEAKELIDSCRKQLTELDNQLEQILS